MFDSNILDTLIGIVFVFALISAASSWATEFIAQLLRLRSKNLKEFLSEWLNDETVDKSIEPFVNKLYKSKTINALYQPGKRDGRFGPSYISPTDFVTGVIETALTTEKGDIIDLQEKIDGYLKANLPKSIAYPMNAMMHEISEAGDTLVDYRKSLENWFDSAMDRCIGIYKRTIWKWGLAAAFVLVIFANVDTVAIATALWSNQDLRTATAASAQAYVESVSAPDLPENGTGDPLEEAEAAAEKVQDLLVDIEELGLPMFWDFEDLEKGEEDPYNQNFGAMLEDSSLVLSKILGLSATALAASFGAQIWFDLLKQLVNLRGSGPNPAEKSGGKGKK